MIEIIVAIIGTGAIGTAIKAIRDIWLKHLEKKKNRFSNIIPLINETYDILNELLVHSKAKKITVLKTTNGGGIPKIGKEINSTIIHEVYDNPMKGFKQKWQKQHIDAGYVQILCAMVEDEETDVNTKNLKDCLIKQIYASQKITNSLFIKIHENDQRMIYLTLNYMNLAHDNLAGKQHITIAKSKLKNIFSNKDYS